jgi:hypothetical protein
MPQADLLQVGELSVRLRVDGRPAGPRRDRGDTGVWLQYRRHDEPL